MQGAGSRPLVEALEGVCGRAAAEALIADGLVEAGLSSLPATRDEVLAFVRRHLLSLVADALGALHAAQFFATFLSALDDAALPDPAPPRSLVAPSPPPPPVRIEVAHRRRVVVVCASRSERQRLVRAFFHAGCDARVVERVADLVELEGLGGPRPSAVVAQLASDEALATVTSIVARVPGLYVVAVVAGDAETDARARLHRAGIARCGVFSTAVRAEDLVRAVESALGEAPSGEPREQLLAADAPREP